MVETALEEELSDHLGYDTHDPVGRNGENFRNGYRRKTVLPEIGRPVPRLPRRDPQVICSTNAVESLNARYRRAVRARRHFPTDQAALNCREVYQGSWTGTPLLRGSVRA